MISPIMVISKINPQVLPVLILSEGKKHENKRSIEEEGLDKSPIL
jgi:hypothetical protein